jgi:hypothetical protein
MLLVIAFVSYVTCIFLVVMSLPWQENPLELKVLYKYGFLLSLLGLLGIILFISIK